jgi:hypothetical protein
MMRYFFLSFGSFNTYCSLSQIERTVASLKFAAFMLSESSIRGGTGGSDTKNFTCSRTDFTTAAGKTLRAQELPATVEHAGSVMMIRAVALLYSTTN